MDNENNMLTEEELCFCQSVLRSIYGHGLGVELEAVYCRELMEVLEGNLSKLPEGSFALLSRMFREGKTQEEAAAELGVSDPEEIRFLLARGLRMLRHPSSTQRICPYLKKIEGEQPEEPAVGAPDSAPGPTR